MTGPADASWGRALDAYEGGDLRLAAAAVGQSFVAARDAGDSWAVARALALVGLVALDGGDEETAARSTAEALATIDPDDDDALATAGLVASRLATREVDHETALRLLGASQARAQPPYRPADALVTASAEVIGSARRALDDRQVEALLEAGRALSGAAVVSLASARVDG